MTCEVKHVKVEITNEDWKCPKCGAHANCNRPDGTEAQGFVIDSSPDEADENCWLTHEKDELHCYECDYSTSGKKMTDLYIKQKGMVTCPTCRGKGVVDGRKTSVRKTARTKG